MATSESLTQLAQARRLAQRLEQHKAEVSHLREEIGDPQEALFTFTRDRFDFLSLFPGSWQRNRHGHEWNEADDLDAW